MGRALAPVILILLAVLVLPIKAFAADHMRFELIPAHDEVAPGGEILIGLRQIPAPGWHSYWQNPGATGLAAQITWHLPKGVRAGKVEWPTPDRLLYAGEVSYGYPKAATLLIPLHFAKTLKRGAILKLSAHVDSLVCKNMCEPVSADVTRSLIVSNVEPSDPSRLRAAMKALPKPFSGSLEVKQQRGFATVTLSPAPTKQSVGGAYLFAESDSLIDPSAPQKVSQGRRGLTLRVKEAGTRWPKSGLHFVLKLADGAAFRLSANTPAVDASPAAPGGLLVLILLAFAGGLILNLMPCVFPILSMKLLALTRAGQDKALAKREALVYGVGAIASFLTLALALMLARTFGSAVGWGFQLQSPLIIAALSLLLLLVALNMSGLFEVGASLQAAAGSVGLDGGARFGPYASAFMTGVLAVVVAAPCTAPFMATAVGVAIAQPGWASMAIFAGLGLGFAAPFVGLTFVITTLPSTVRLLPKPGRWMVRLRQVLAIPMYASVAWLVWVFAHQASTFGLVLLLAALVLVAFAVLHGKLPINARRGVALVGAGLMVVAAQAGGAVTLVAPSVKGRVSFSQQRLATLRTEGHPVLVDMSAAWCITCKANETLVLDSPEVRRALAKSHTTYMVGDWTRENPAISRYLASFGRTGVPLYVYYAPGDAAPVVLPQLLNAHNLVARLTASQG